MGRYTGPVFRKSRRLEMSILETNKEFSKGKRRQYPPGQHGQGRRRRINDYLLQLTEKQKLRFVYGVSEKHLVKVFRKAVKMPGITGENMMFILESRIDNIVYRLGLAATRRASRQLVNHNHVLLNDRKASIPSMQVKPGDTIKLKDKSKKFKCVDESLKLLASTLAFVKFNKKTMTGEYLRLPEREELNQDIKENLIVEFYSRK